MKYTFILFCIILSSSLCLGQDQTIMIGDSIFARNGEVENYLETNKGLNIDSYAQSGARMSQIVSQYHSASKILSNGIVIMNGGGNDILRDNLRDCLAFNDACRTAIDAALDLGQDLIQDMADDGMEHVVVLGYYYTEGYLAGLKNAHDYGMERLYSICEQSISFIGCYVVDPRGPFSSGTGLIESDGIHPTIAGSRVLANLIWDEMDSNIF